MSRRSDALGIAAALFYVLLWASAYVPSKIGVLDSSPIWFLVVRFGTAGSIAFIAARVMGARLPQTRGEWFAVFVLGVLGNAIYLGLTYEALRHLASGVGSLIASTNPLVLAIIAPYVLRENLTPLKIAGLVFGFGGVVAVMLARSGSGSADPLDVMLAFTGVLGSVAATVVFKKYCGNLDVRMTTALQLLAAGLVLLPFAPLLDGAPHMLWTPRIIASFFYVVLVMSFGASILWFWLLGRGEASRVSAFYFLTPVFGLALAFLLLHEPVGARDIGGLVAIALGISLVQRA
ncbi:MAG: DMT family transporter [Candidatus Velthaea sp.]